MTKQLDDLLDDLLPVKEREGVTGEVFPTQLDETRLAVLSQLDGTKSIDELVQDFEPLFEEQRVRILVQTFIERFRRKDSPCRLVQPEEDERRPLNFTDDEVKDFVATADDNGFLKSTFFREVLVPQLTADSQGNSLVFSQLMTTALACLPHLSALDTSGATRSFTNPAVYSQFFEVEGPFQTFMRQFGPEAAIAAAAFQGGGEFVWEETGNEPWEVPALLAAITPGLDVLDPELHPFFFQALGGQCLRSRRDGEHFLSEAPAILTQLQTSGAGALIPLWLTMASTGSASYQKELFDLKLCVPDLLEISSCEERQPGSLSFFLFYLRDAHPSGGAGGVRFADKNRGFGNDLPEVITHLEEAGYSKERISEILSLSQTQEELQARHVSRIIEHYPELEQNFPGGVEALIAFIKRIPNCPSGAGWLIYYVSEGRFPPKNLQVFLEVGVAAARVLDNSAHDYFTVNVWQSKLLNSDPQKFATRVDRLAGLAARLSHLRTFITSHPRTYLFSGGLHRIDDSDDQFDAFCVGAEKLCADFTETTVSAGDTYNGPLRDYVYPMSIFFDCNHNPKGPDALDFEAEINWDFHAEQVLRFHEDPSADGPYQLAECARKPDSFISGARLAYAFHHGDGPQLELTDLVDWHSRILALNAEIGKYKNADLPREEVFRLRQEWLACYDRLTEELKTVKHSDLVAQQRLLELRGEIDDIVHALLFRGFICGILKPDMRVAASEFLRQAHPGTQVAVIGGTLLHALGLVRDPLINPELGPMSLPFEGRALIDASQPLRMSDKLIVGEFGSELRRRIDLIAPRVEGQVLAERLSITGAAFVGGKGHTRLAIPNDRLDNIRGLFGLEGGTPFSLMHHNSVRLPPSPTALELSYSVKLFALLGIPFDSLQVCAAGHWPEEVCRIVAATYLLGTSDSPTYEAGAFSTTHNEATGNRLLVRGAGVVDRSVPFFLSGIPQHEDRTDVLGRIGTDDFALSQWVGTLVPHALYGGRFEAEGRRWLEQMHDLMTRRGLRDALESTTWVLQNPGDTIDPARNHEAVVRGLTDLWQREVRQPHFGLVGEVQSLLASGAAAIQKQRETVQVEEQDDFLRMMRW